MIRRLFRIGLLLGLLGGVAFALTKLLPTSQPTRPRRPSARRSRGHASRATRPSPRHRSHEASPTPRRPSRPRRRPAAKRWVEPTGGVCPATHPVKAKIGSKIFHLPGMANYERTKPDRCYVDAARPRPTASAPPSASDALQPRAPSDACLGAGKPLAGGAPT